MPLEVIMLTQSHKLSSLPSPVPGMGNLSLSCWSGSPRNFPSHCLWLPTKLEGKTAWLKIPHTLCTGFGGIKLKLT